MRQFLLTAVRMAIPHTKLCIRNRLLAFICARCSERLYSRCDSLNCLCCMLIIAMTGARKWHFTRKNAYHAGRAECLMARRRGFHWNSSAFTEDSLQVMTSRMTSSPCCDRWLDRPMIHSSWISRAFRHSTREVIQNQHISRIMRIYSRTPKEANIWK